MNFTNISQDNPMLDGFYKQGELSASYDKIVSVFGQPYVIPDEDQDKSQVEWVIKWEDGTVSTIYDWAWGETEVNDIPIWSIGGLQYHSALYVHELMY
jgi:hypothetical protein